MGPNLAMLTMYPKLLTSAVIAGVPIIYLVYLHGSLSRKTKHTTTKGPLTASTTHNIDTIPESAITSGSLMVHDIAFRSIPTALLPALDQTTLLTTYLRHTMTRFSRFPQGRIIRLVSKPPASKTFADDYIQRLEFKEGDLVCGIYLVVARSGNKVELAMESGPVNGRLVVAIEEKEEESIFISETVMWKGKNEKVVMPLERRLPKWAHEIASWSLLDSGTKYLLGLRKTI